MAGNSMVVIFPKISGRRVVRNKADRGSVSENKLISG